MTELIVAWPSLNQDSGRPDRLLCGAEASYGYRNRRRQSVNFGLISLVVNCGNCSRTPVITKREIRSRTALCNPGEG